MDGVIFIARLISGIDADYYEGSLDDFRIDNISLTVNQMPTLFETVVYSGWASIYGLSGDDA